MKKSAFFDVLQEGRGEFNERFVAARRAGLRVDEDEFSEVLLELVGPVVEAVAEVDEMAALATTRVLFDIGLRLKGRGLLGAGSRHFQINGLWMSELPKLARFLVEEPERVVSSLSNAAHHLATSREGDAGLWRTYLMEVAADCADADELLAVGKVLAWRAGLAHFRESALVVWEELPEGLKYQVLGVSKEVGDVEVLRARLQDRWAGLVIDGVRGGRQVVARVGGFIGAGGVFVEPPLVGIVEGQFYGFDREAVFSIHADVYGACCQRAPQSVADALRDQWLKDAGTINDEIRRLQPGFKDATSVANSPDTTAMSVDHSHFVYLIA